MKGKKMENPLKIVWIVLGFLCLGLGTIGIVTSYSANRSVLQWQRCSALPRVQRNCMIGS